MKKRILAFLLAVSIAVSMLVLPASAAGNANTAVQLSITLNAMDSSQQAALNAVVTRGALARMLVSYSTYRERDRKSTRLNSSHIEESRMPSSA